MRSDCKSERTKTSIYYVSDNANTYPFPFLLISPIIIINIFIIFTANFQAMRRNLIFIFILLITSLLGFSQNPTQDSIVPKKPTPKPTKPIDSTFVTYNAYPFDSIFLNASKVIDTLTFHASDHEVLERERTIYSTLSNTGLAHKSMIFNHLHQVGFDMTLPAFSAYMQNESNIVSYQSVLPYSEIRYVMTTGDKEQHLNVKFGRQFTHNLFISFAFNSDFSPGVFKNNRTLNNYFWVNAHYLTDSKRYGVMAYYYRNKLEMGENGGIVRDEDYSSHTESDNSVINVNLSTATNFVVSSGIGFEHYFNLLPQNGKAKTPKKKKKGSTPILEKSNDTITENLLTVDSTLFINDSTLFINDSTSFINDSTAFSNDSIPIIIDSIPSIIDSIPNINDSIAIDSIPSLMDSISIHDEIEVDSLDMEKPMDSLLTGTSDTLDIVPKTKARKFTLGRICHSFSYLNNKLYYNESSPSVAFYQSFDTLLNTSKTTDTTLVRAIRNTVRWNSLGYQKYNDDIPFFLYAGLTHGFYSVKHFDYIEGETVLSRNYQQLSVNGGIIINLFKSTRITGHADLITLGYQIGDFDIKGQWKQFLGTSNKNFGYATFDAEIKRQSANWFEEKYTSNHFRWENDFKAATYLTFNLKYNYKSYCIGVKQTSIANLIYFGTDARPTQFEGLFSIREAYLSFYQKLWRFEFEGFVSMQKSSNEEIMHLPLLLGQLKIGYAQSVFHKAATLYPSITVRYFTKYYADAYMPATRTFYLQNEVQIGNFPFIDLAIALKVKKAHIYFSYSNMFLLSGNYNSFIAPHYPMRDSRIFIGINWRLFN